MGQVYDMKELEEVASLPLAKLCYQVENFLEEEVINLFKKLLKCEELNIKSAFRELTKNKQNISFYAAGRTLEKGGGYALLRFLEMHNFPMNLIDGFNQNPLFYAAREFNTEACQLLIQGKCDVNHLDKNSQNCLYYAASDNSIKKNKKGKRINNKPSRVSTITLLMNEGVDVHHIDSQNRSVTHYTRDEDIKNLLYLQNTNPKRRKLVRSYETPPQKPSSSTMASKNARHNIYEHDANIKDDNDPDKIVRKVKYFVDYARLDDTNSLSKLENEFVEDHQQILATIFSETPSFESTCASLGLHKSASNRKNIISAIATKCDKFARTLKVYEAATGEVVGYLYFKCTPGSGARTAKDRKQEKQLEISHLKVANSHRRRGLGQALFFGVLQHLQYENIGEYANDTRLSVFDANAAAVALYERLGFEMFNEAWHSPMKDWPGKNPVPEIAWRRYRRVIPCQEEEAEKKSRKRKRSTTGM